VGTDPRMAGQQAQSAQRLKPNGARHAADCAVGR
jgi:hypothetical protein